MILSRSSARGYPPPLCQSSKNYAEIKEILGTDDSPISFGTLALLCIGSFTKENHYFSIFLWIAPNVLDS